MDSRTRIGVGLAVVGALLLLAAWWLFGGVQTPTVEAPRKGVGRVAVAPKQPPPYLRRDDAGKVEAPPELPEADVAPTTKACKYIIEWQQQNVHDFVILDNLDAQSQRFNEADIACLTAAGARNAILEYAERNTVVPVLPPGQKVGATP